MSEMLATALFACGTAGGTVAAATGSTGGGGFGLPIALGAIATYAVAASILALGLLGLALVVTLSRRGGPAATPVPIGATVSPDGLYWWDGTAWRPVR